MSKTIKMFLAAACVIGTAINANAAPLDHMLTRGDQGVFSRSNQLALEWSSALGLTGMLMWSDSQSTFGKTTSAAWDAMAASAVSAELLKVAVRRQRPRDGNDPSAWFSDRSNRSFPSGEVAHITAIVTPFIETYRHENPAVWLLSALPIYDGIARMKSQAHWQTDVLAGAALGAGMGLYCQGGSCPVQISPLLRGVGLSWTGRF
jgi:membrane-associated phospholipid phosphatase